MGALFARDLACYVRGLCAPVGRCRLSQQSNNNSACRYTVMLALGASAWEYPAQLLSITTHAPRIFVTPAKHVFFSAKKQISQQNSFLLSLSCAAVKFD